MYVQHQPDTKARELSAEHAEIVKATLPVIGAHINEITPIFYKRMFEAHPELISDTFNRGNQKQGEQQKALAASIAVFASMLVDPNAPDPREMLARIGHKHVSLGIVEDQYPIVHEHLFAAIVEVLGDAITPDVAAAWDSVYWIMADCLIDYEKDLYKTADVEPGDVFRMATVEAREELNSTVTMFTLVGDDLGEALPGQYTSVGVKLPDGARQLRQYSLISAEKGRWQIAVQHDGEVSTYLFENVKAGDPIQITIPAGDLVLREGENPVVLISQGIGSTPMVGMLASLVAGESSREVLAVHADSSEVEFAQRSQMEDLTGKLSNGQLVTSFREDGSRIDVASLIPAGADIYLCGGTNFLQNMRDQIDALPADKAPAAVYYELFSPNDWLVS